MCFSWCVSGRPFVPWSLIRGLLPGLHPQLHCRVPVKSKPQRVRGRKRNKHLATDCAVYNSPQSRAASPLNLRTRKTHCNTPVYIRDLSGRGFGYPWGSWNQSLLEPKGWLWPHLPVCSGTHCSGLCTETEAPRPVWYPLGELWLTLKAGQTSIRNEASSSTSWVPSRLSFNFTGAYLTQIQNGEHRKNNNIYFIGPLWRSTRVMKCSALHERMLSKWVGRVREV